MFKRTPTSKAKKEGRKAVKRAEKASKKAAKRAEKAGKEAQERAADYAEKAGEIVGDTAADIADRIRKSDSLAKAQKKGVEYAALAKDKWDDSDLEDRLEDIAERVRKSDTAKKAQKRTKDVTDSSLDALGEWLTSSKQGKQVGEKLGVQKKRRWRTVAAGLIGVGAGFAIARLIQPKPLPELYDDFATSADRLGGPVTGGTLLVDTIRSSLDRDERTAKLDQLSINVAEGTVFVRGTVPEGTDEAAVREVVAAVPGVVDVDLQLTTAASQG